MATATAYLSVNMDTASVWYGNVTVATSSQIQITYGGQVQNYYGNFTYNAFGLSGGTVTSSNYFEFGKKVYEISGGKYSALTIERFVNSGDMKGLFAHVFNGVDLFNGSGQADALNGFAGNDVIRGNGGNDLLKGGSGNDDLNGGAGNDVVIGGTGADTMLGGAGNDTYYVDNAGDKVYETTTTSGRTNAGGTDKVISSVSFDLSAYAGVSFVEHLTLTGSGAINGTGNAYNNVLTGNAGANVLKGLAGNDKLDGGGGADRMEGGVGNDTYVVNHARDVVVEAANAGTDTVQSSRSYTLGANLENLTLTGTAAINGTGNALANTIVGNAAANGLRGGNGNDVLSGGGGNDVLIGGAGSDRLTGGAGSDFFQFDSKLGSDTITDFSSAADTFRFSQSGIRIGDGDTAVDGFSVRGGTGGYSTASEVVVFTPNIHGEITTSTAAAVIGTASSKFAAGATRLFVVDNGGESGLFLFTSSALDAHVSVSELIELATFNGTTTAHSDYVFIG